MNPAKAPSQVAVWFFVGATFAFSSTSLFFGAPELLWVRITMMVIGFVLVVAGGVRLGQELSAPQRHRAGPPETPDPRSRADDR